MGVRPPDASAIQKHFCILCGFILCLSILQAISAVTVPESFAFLPHSRYLSFPFFLFSPRFSSSHINVFSLPSLGPFTLSSFLPSSLCREPVRGWHSWGLSLAQVLEPSCMENSPKGSQGHHLLSVEDKRLLDNLLDLLSGPAMGEFQRANRGRTLGLEEPHYCHGHLCFSRCCLAQESCFGHLGGQWYGGRMGSGVQKLCCSDSLSSSIHTGEAIWAQRT